MNRGGRINNQVFSLAQTRLETALAAVGLEPPLLLQQSLFSRRLG